MRQANKSVRYHASMADLWKHRSIMGQILLMFTGTIFFALSLRNETIRNLLLWLSLTYPLIIGYQFLFMIRKFNYTQSDEIGLHTTILGIFQKHIIWSEVAKLDKTNLMNIEMLGVEYKPSVKRYIFGRKLRLKMYGWDELIAPAYGPNGESLLDDVKTLFKKQLANKNKR